MRQLRLYLAEANTKKWRQYCPAVRKHEQSGGKIYKPQIVYGLYMTWLIYPRCPRKRGFVFQRSMAHTNKFSLCVCRIFGVKIQVDIGKGRQECNRWEGRGGGHQVFAAMAAWLAQELVEVKARSRCPYSLAFTVKKRDASDDEY